MNFFKADPDHFDVVFVANATAAIKLVADAFRDTDESGFWYGYHKDAHTSLVGVCELAAESRCFESDLEVEGWLNGRSVDSSSSDSAVRTGLFAYPAQSNMNGHRLPLDWASRVCSSQRPDHQKIYTLLDATAFVMTAQLDLSDSTSAPDFIALSFYKIFGFPDLGALIVRRAACNVLQQRRYFGGGTVDMITTLQNPWHAKKDQTIHEQLEDGTLPFHSIFALDAVLQVHAELYGSMANISRHTCALAYDLYDQLRRLRHANGRVVCEIYKDPNSQYGNAKTQGPTVAFNIRNAQGGWIKKSDVESLAILRNIHLRTGGVCNPGGIASFCQLSYPEMRKNYSEGMRCGDTLDVLGGKPTGIIRVSLGAMSTQGDVQKFIDFVQELFVENKSTVTLAKISPPGSLREVSSIVESLIIFPIGGCLGWQVPKHNRWSIGATRLAWDHEWCVVGLKDGQPLESHAHQGMMLIKPYLDIEKGTLGLVSAVDTKEIVISIWETPSNVDQSVFDYSYLPADLYHSKDVAYFFTSIIGVPCTLARFQDRKRNSKERAHNWAAADLRRNVTSHSATYRRSTITTGATANSYANIVVSGMPDLSNSHIRIGHQYFEILLPPGLSPNSSLPPSVFDTISSSILHLHPLHNSYDQSLAAQNPTIKVGDRVRTFSASSNGTTDVPFDLRACLTFCDAGDHVCPVVRCWKVFPTAEELSSHFHAHTSSPVIATDEKTDSETSDVSTNIDEGKGQGKCQDGKLLTKSPKSSYKNRWKAHFSRIKVGAITA